MSFSPGFGARSLAIAVGTRWVVGSVSVKRVGVTPSVGLAGEWERGAAEV